MYVLVREVGCVVYFACIFEELRIARDSRGARENAQPRQKAADSIGCSTCKVPLGRVALLLHIPSLKQKRMASASFFGLIILVFSLSRLWRRTLPVSCLQSRPGT